MSSLPSLPMSLSHPSPPLSTSFLIHPSVIHSSHAIQTLTPYFRRQIVAQRPVANASEVSAIHQLFSPSSATVVPILSSVIAASIVATGDKIVGGIRTASTRQAPHAPTEALPLASILSGVTSHTPQSSCETVRTDKEVRKVISPFSYATSAAVESFYRSAMNHLVNEKVRGVTSLSDANLSLAALFPKMYLQIPTRVVYITGLKQIRATLDGVDVKALFNTPHATTTTTASGFTASGFKGTAIDHEPISTHNLWSRFSVAATKTLFLLAPGIIMCPLSSLLEASNVSPTMNAMPLLTHRWRCGYMPRLTREIIFAVGINQAADRLIAFYSTAPSQPTVVQSTAGSLTAGLLAGYLSHVPHVLSALRLMNPTTSYATLWKTLYSARMSRLQSSRMSTTKNTFWPLSSTLFIRNEILLRRSAMLLTVLFPIGVVRRSMQIAGSFAIINGLTYLQRQL